MRLKTLEQKSAQDLAGLQVDLLQRLRSGNMSWEQIDWFRGLSFEKREKLMGKLVKTEQYPKMKLVDMKLVDTNVVATGLAGEFDPQKHFNENKTVKYWKSDNFQKYVLNSAKTVKNLPEMNFSKHQLTETITDKEVMEHFQISESTGLMTREEILWTIASLTSKQPKGEAGALLNNAYVTIIGYMLCDDGVVRAVDVFWHSDNAEWCCRCDGLGRWDAGNELLSRK